MPAIVLNQAMAITRAGGQIGVPGLYVNRRSQGQGWTAKQGSLKIRFGLGRANNSCHGISPAAHE